MRGVYDLPRRNWLVRWWQQRQIDKLYHATSRRRWLWWRRLLCDFVGHPADRIEDVPRWIAPRRAKSVPFCWRCCRDVDL